VEKLLIHAYYTPTSGWCPSFLGGKCDATWWSNLAFHCLFWSVIVSSSFLCGAWWYMIVELLLMVISFLFFSFFLFSLLPMKVHDCSPCFLCFNFNLYSINLLFLLYFFIIFFFNLILQLQFLICYFLHLGPYSFDS